MAGFDQKARLKEVAEQLKKQKELEEKQDLEDYNNLIKGPLWKVFTGLMLFSTLLSVLVTIDTFFDGKTEKLPFENIRFYYGQLIYEEAYYTPYSDLIGFEESTFEVVRSGVFGQAKFIQWKSEVYQADDSAPKIYEDKKAMKRLSIYEYFPWPSIAFLIPLIVFVFKRPSPFFKFGRYFCFLIVYPGSIIIFLALLF